MKNRCCSCSNCNSYRNRADRVCNCSRCSNFIFPCFLGIIRDMTRHCRCNWVNRYDRFRY